MAISLFHKVFAIFLKDRDFEKILVVTTFPYLAYILILLAICFWRLVLQQKKKLKKKELTSSVGLAITYML